MMNKKDIDYKKVIVEKPWGHEYLIYDNGLVGIWYLHINQGDKTSMHCHPRKKTGLILLRGEAVLSFFNDSTTLKPLNKMMIREGLFHSTCATAPQGADILEVETPCNKGNLVRFDDEYGREDKPYEGRESYKERTSECLYIENPQEGKSDHYKHCGYKMSCEKVSGIAQLSSRANEEIIIVLSGGLLSKSREPVLKGGDVVSSDTLRRLSERFTLLDNLSILTLHQS